MDINIIGAGLVGKTLGVLLVKHSRCRIGAVLNTSLSSAKHAIKVIGQGTAVACFADLPQADITLLSVPDSVIPSVCCQLLKANVLKSGSTVLHFSGVLSASVLTALNSQACFVARAHPVKHMSDVSSAVKTFKGTYCALEGDEAAVAVITPILTDIQARVVHMPLQKDCKYHTACVFASTFPQLIVAAAAKLYRECGLTPDVATMLSRDLAQRVLSPLNEAMQPADFVEGPVKRKDMEGVKQNFQTISNPQLKQLYQSIIAFALTLLPNEKGVGE